MPIKRSTQALSFAGLSNETTAARPAAGSASTVRRATNRRTIGNLADRCQRDGASLIGRHQRFDSIPDHQAGASGPKRLPCGSPAVRRPSIARLSGRRCKAEARLSRTFGLGSVLASSANRATAAGAGGSKIAEQPDAPRPDVLAGLIEQGERGFLVKAAAHVQGPYSPQSAGDVGISL